MIAGLLWLAAGLFLLLQIPPILGVLNFRAYVKRALERRTSRPYAPRLSVIIPCKGLDPGFRENMRSIIEQEYPDFELIFVTAARDDPARECLETLLSERTAVKARLVTAGILPGRSQKLNNQLEALRAVRPESEALAFLDSDIRAHPAFLRSLIEPLGGEKTGATTGFRWYVPENGGFGSYLRATWNGGGAPALAQRSLTYAWGGAMAIRKADFERLGIGAKWATALTDDFPLTDAVRNDPATGDVVFVPRCLVASHEDSSFSQAIEWTNRQTIICRVYNPKLWWALFISYAVQSVALLLGAAFILARLLGAERGVNPLPAALLFAAIPVQVAFGMLLWQTVRKDLLPEIGGWGKAFKHALLVPVAIFVIFYNSVYSLFTKDICWRGVKYRLLSRDETVVLPGDLPPGESEGG